MRRGIAIDRNRLRRLRLEKIGTRELLAVQAGLSVSAIALYETGHRSPTLEALERLAAAQRGFSRDSMVKREKDDDRFTELVKQTYRVLLTRGMKGCYIYFEDDPTREFFESRVDFQAVRRSMFAEAAAAESEPGRAPEPGTRPSGLV